MVALGRSLLAAILLWAFDRYGVLLLKKDDRERYKKLLILISQLKSEVVWMNQNTLLIEDTMSTSYSLYNDLNQAGSTASAQKALTVAKDVHEIKKEYFLIMRGISSSLNDETGEINRGLGLVLIQDIVREELQGTISIQSSEGGTVFTVKLPKKTLGIVSDS